MVRKTLMSLLLAGGVAVVPVAWAEEGSGGSTGSGSYGSGSGPTSGSMDGGSSSGMSGSGTASEIYQRECITAAQKRTQRCMDLQKSIEGGESGAGPSGSGGSDTPSGMGSGSSTTSPTVP